MQHRNQLLVVAACGLLLSGCSKKNDEAKAEAPAPVQVTSVTQDTIRRTVDADGVLYPQDQASIMSKISAPVQKFMVNRGDHVKAGQLVATLESGDLSAALEESQGQLDGATSALHMASATVPEEVNKARSDVQADQQALDAAQRAFEGRQKLLDQGAIAGKAVDDARVAFAQAKSQLDAAKEHLRTLESVGTEEQVKTAKAQTDAARSHLQGAEAQEGYAVIHSPINGVVADRPLYAGEMASAGAPLMTVMDISRIVARVNVPQTQATAVKIGQPATITETDNGEKLEGKVTVVSPATDPNSTTVQVWITSANPGERFKPGAAVHAAIEIGIIRNALVVPASAILPGEEGGTAVLTVSSDSTAHLRPVEVGVRYGDKAQILNGVQPGEEVVTVGGLGVDDKAKVKVVGAADEKADEDEDAPPPPPEASKSK
ncbi:MAG: efflux RND transporter periplasmic adaptor subunit [Acidobacteriota bacterium]|nr:efflux RND transporter periplasmic adaptor subunit [Acidobacteriota bacterium]